jgi:hypothetical protein
MESFWTAIIAAFVGVAGTLVTQRVLRSWTRRDETLVLRQEWVTQVLDEVKTAWSEMPFDSEKLDKIIPPELPNGLTFVDPSAQRVQSWVTYRLLLMMREWHAATAEPDLEGNEAYFIAEEGLHRMRHVLVGWARGEFRYRPGAIERWVWSAFDEVHAGTDSATWFNSKSVKKIRRRITRAQRRRP